MKYESPSEEWPCLTSTVLHAAFRYALGRMTYIAEEITEEIRLAGPCLSSVHRSMIHKEIRKALDTDRAGMQVDRDEWARILELPVEDE